MKTLFADCSVGASSALALAERMHARHNGAQKATMLLRFARGGQPDLDVVPETCRSSGLGDAVFLELGDDFVVLASGTDSRAGIELAASTFERELARRSRVPRGVGLAHNLRPGGLDLQLPLQTLLEVAREGAVVAEMGGGGRVCHTELYELFGPPMGAPSTAHPPALPREEVDEPRAIESRAAELRAVDTRFAPEPGAVGTGYAAEPRAVDPTAAESSKLDRRLHKLLGELERARARIMELEHLTAVDTGLESVHRAVQGLDGTAHDYERRFGIMTSIFRANLELRSAPIAPAAA